MILQSRSPNERVIMMGGGVTLISGERKKRRFSFHPARRCQVESVHLSPGDFYVCLGSPEGPRGVLFLARS